jgi:ribonuclease BN (tRNA processing enzyme)
VGDVLVKLTVIGNSGSYPGPESAASCYLLEHEEAGRTWRILLDLGSGALGSLQRIASATNIDGVFLSHLHADHCLDLCGYYVMRKYHPQGALPKIPVYGPADTARRMAKAYDLDEDPGMNEEFEFISYGAMPIDFGPFRVTARQVVHPVTAYALRVEAAGRTLAYSGDSGVCHGLDDTARASDLFLCEASFLEGAPNPPDLHLTGADAGRTAARAGTQRLLLTHVPPWHDPQVVLGEAVEEYDGKVEMATVGTAYDI